MLLATRLYDFEERNLVDALSFVSDLGCKHVELLRVPPTDEDACRLRELCSTFDLKVAACLRVERARDLDEANRKDTFLRFQREMERVLSFGCHCFAAFFFHFPDALQATDTVRNWLTTILPLLEAGDEHSYVNSTMLVRCLFTHILLRCLQTASERL